MLSTEATVIAVLLTPGAPADQMPDAPELPAEMTMVTPASDSASAACPVGYSLHVMNGAPSDMLTTSMPSARARSMAARMISVSTEPSQPKTRYAPKVTSGATPVTSPSAPTMPATWVPCPPQSSGTGSGFGTGWYVAEVGSAL